MEKLHKTSRFRQHIASDGQKSFCYNFEIYYDEEVTVRLNDSSLKLTKDYTVTGTGIENGGTIELVTGAAAGDIITINGNTFIFDYNKHIMEKNF